MIQPSYQDKLKIIALQKRIDLNASLLSHINAAYLPYLSDFRRYQILKGGAGCIGGNSLIETPHGNIKIKHFKGGEVFSWDGEKTCIAIATKRKKYKKAPLYELKTKEGLSILVTLKHRFLTDQGWKTTSEILASPVPMMLCGALQSQQSSILDISQKVQHVNVRNYFEKVEDSQKDYFSYYRQDDVQLHSVKDSVLNVPPLPIDADGHTRFCLQTGDCILSQAHNPIYQLLYRLSKKYLNALLHNPKVIRECCVFYRPFEFLLSIFQRLFRFLLCSFRFRQVFGFDQAILYHNDYSFRYLHIESITYKGMHVYYDINVPTYHNYIAEGMIHHNSGKSVFCSQKIIYNMRYRVGYNGLVLRNTGRDNHDSTFAELQKAIMQFGMLDLFDINHSRGAEEITCKINNNRIVFRGLDDVEKVKSVTFKTGDLVFVWIEEASETAEADFNQLDLRLRGQGAIPKHLMISFNPIDITSWLKARFFDFPIAPEDGYILETTYKDNAFLDDAYKKILEGYKDKDYYFYQVYVLNQWGARTTARVFHNVVIEDFEVDWNKLQNLRQGIDFGFNHANAFEQMGFIDGELYIVGEVYAKNMINRVFIQSVKDNLGVMAVELSATADSADPDKISEFNQEGFSVHGAQKGPGSLMAGVNYLKALPKIHIHKTNCPNAAREFVRMKYRELKDGTILDEVVEIDDDTIAAVRYATEDLHASTEGGGHYFIQRTNW